MFLLPVGAVLAAGAFIPVAGKAVIAGAALLLGAVSPVFIYATGVAARGPDAAGRSRLFGLLLRTEAILLCMALRIPFGLQQSEAFWGIPTEKIAAVSGILSEDSTPAEDGSVRFVLRAERVEDHWGNRAAAEADLLITAAGSIPAELFQGTEVALPVTLYQIHAAGDKWYGSSRGAVKVLKYPAGIPAVRRDVSRFIRNRLRSTGVQAAPLLEALLLGYRDIRADKICELFRRTGAIHLLALSGMHLGVITMGVLVLLVPLLGRARAAFAALVFIGIYLFLVGPRPSLVRAVLMYGTGVTGYMIRRKRPAVLHLLVLSFFIQSTSFPGIIGTLGFQLSYLALGGILLFTEPVKEVLPWWIPPPLS
ncbi:MAG: ComEC/Rec2 family competence protein, partial [Sediminispirochaetaceae bacterium]